MKSPLLFTGKTDYAYASGVIRGLENYLLGRSEYQKLIDSDPDSIDNVLAEFGYSSSEKDPEIALNLATEKLFETIDKLSKGDKIADIWKVRADFSKISAIVKSILLDTEPPELVTWGFFNSEKLSREIYYHFDPEKKCSLPVHYIKTIERAQSNFKSHKTTLSVDIAVDSSFSDYVSTIVPASEYFKRFWSFYVDWWNVKAFVRIRKAKLSSSLFYDTFNVSGDIPLSIFTDAMESDNERLSTHFMHTEYGKSLQDVIKQAFEGMLIPLDNYFRGKLLAHYKYTRYCLYGLELLLAYESIKLEEIAILRTIVRAKKARLPVNKLKEVINFALE